MSTLTAEILKNTRSAFPLRHLTQADHLSHLFLSYYNPPDGKRVLETDTANRFYTGVRLLPVSLIRHYADKTSPVCPIKLYDDIELYVSTTHRSSSEKRNTQDSLCSFIDLLPPEDRDELLCDTLPDHPTITDLTDLMTRLLWYAICYDHYEAARSKQAG